MNPVAAFTLCLAACAPLLGFAQDKAISPGAGPASSARYKLKPDVSFLGMRSEAPGGNAEARIPFDKPYESLTPAQQSLWKSRYESMEAGDEPPFPIGGLATLYDPLTKGQQRLLVEGMFIAEVMVGANGEAESISVLKTPSERVTKFVAGVALLTKYKPALCRGVPCAMAFPIRIHLATR